MHGDHHHHEHAHGADQRRIAIAFCIIFVFTLVEFAGGIISGSLALLADAGHMVSDAAALAMSWAAMHLAKRPADKSRSYGYQRLEVLAAFVNGCALFAIAGWIVFEAVQRILSPHRVIGATMMGVAIAGLFANLAAFAVLNRGTKRNLNLRSAWLHILSDIFGFIVAIIAAAIIMATRWYPIDPILSAVVALLILRSAYGIVHASGHILLEGTPPGMNTDEICGELQTVLPPEALVHHVHVWGITAERAIATLHVSGLKHDGAADAIRAIKQSLRARYGITHSTIQIENDDCADDWA